MAAPSKINDVSLAFSPELDDADKRLQHVGTYIRAPNHVPRLRSQQPLAPLLKPTEAA